MRQRQRHWQLQWIIMMNKFDRNYELRRIITKLSLEISLCVVIFITSHSRHSHICVMVTINLLEIFRCILFLTCHYAKGVFNEWDDDASIWRKRIQFTIILIILIKFQTTVSPCRTIILMMRAKFLILYDVLTNHKKFCFMSTKLI